MKVYNMVSAKGNKVPNQFIIQDGERVTFQSYDSTIVTIDYDKKTVTVGRNWDYSRTTGKYRNYFMQEYLHDMRNTDEFRKALNTGKATMYRGAISGSVAGMYEFKVVKAWEV